MIHNLPKSIYYYSSLLSFSMAVLLAIPNVLPAVDCPTIRAKVKQEKGVIERNKILQDAIENCSNDQQINYFYAYNLERLRKYDQALQYYKQASLLDQQHAKSYFGIGDTQLALGRPEEAITAFEQGLSISPNNIWAKRSLKQAQLKLQEKERSPDRVDEPVQKRTMAPVAQKSEPAVQKVEVAALPPTRKTSQQETNNIRIASLSEVDAANDITKKPAGKKQVTSIKSSPSNIPLHFPINSSELNTDSIEILDQVICPALLSSESDGALYELAGHTDDRGSFEVNMNISKQRVYAVKDHLVAHCKIEPDALQVVYYGQTKPLVPNTTNENQQLNRRVEIRRIR